MQQGGIILYPTDTIWGIGCDATNAEAVKRVYDIKKRSDSKALLVLLDSENRLMQYVSDVPEVAWELIEASDKPLTIIYSGAKNLASNLIAEDGSIGIRVVRDEFCEKLIGRFRKPLVSTSANISGEQAPAIFNEITDAIKASVDYIVEHRQDDTTKSPASSIIKLDASGRFTIIR
ncbi:MAG TPA: threonylcarbamoyl-AMP synthase [Bacteroidales bacterium]|nr:threonylcarbamoyl-AMP synthase [Bacteroidales bacterium]